MLVILIENQLLAPQIICQGCLLAYQSSQLRWNSGQLSCSHLVPKLIETKPDQYECKMGFRIDRIE
ncbi:MAG: hypothetical protein O4861_10130 [Trichodesmium sp. St16_bin4-tuft]|nr:hypothetical protein [Trichodesmium sp. MAG_R01]MDE5073854.1 hypothetical protein [Trichodesmium sp. St5_bin8]MDE5077513.1 hypothetical protein [Trichodesmium sp. St2_bin6]MDE5098669.1 hypothetical protein [Trichodesmium sp. St16_bin4-tuft]MDE5103574.1 hypothetical protein [Trichodesmium sp. St19_bin2]